MYVKFLKDFSSEDSDKLEKSHLYSLVLKERYYPISNVYYNEYFNGEFSNHSFVIFKNDVPLMLVYAFCKDEHFSFFNTPIRIYVDNTINADDTSKLYMYFYKTLKDYIKAHNFSSLIYVNNDFVTSLFYGNIKNVELQYEATIDLSFSENLIKQNIRKSYKSLVNWGQRELDCKLFDSENITEQIFNDFKNFHILVSGRKTRSDKTWDIQLETIKEGHGYLLMSYYEGKLVSSNYVEHGTEEALYGVGVYDRDLMYNKLALAHYPLLYSIYHAKKISLKRFNLGAISHKEMEVVKNLNIFKFKRGFATEVSINNIVTLEF